MDDNTSRRMIFLAYFPVSIVLLWLSMRYLLPALAPFLLAFFLAWLVEPCVKYISYHLGWKRWVTCLSICLLGLSVTTILSVLLFSQLWNECLTFFQALPSMSQEFTTIASRLDSLAYPYIIAFPTTTQPYLWDVLHQLERVLSSFPTLLLDWLIPQLTRGLQHLPNLGFTTTISVLAFYFTSSEYNRLQSIIISLTPCNIRPLILPVPHRLRSSLGGWLKSQLVLMALCFLQLLLLFLLLNLDYALTLALLISLIDALPVFGAGAVLIPWAIFQCVLGNFTLGMSLILTYLLVSMVRATVEPKLIGAHVGIPPLFTLITLYIGFQYGGILGVILAPIVSIFIKELCFPPENHFI